MNDRFLQFLGITKKSGKLLEGYNKCEDALTKTKLHLIILSKDCSENTKDKFIKYCDLHNVPVIEGYNKEELGYVLGRIEINVLGVTDNKMSEKLINLWNENNNEKFRG